jgi:hypothetical protein
LLVRKNLPSIELPSHVANEIADAARRTRRSVVFIVARALAAGRGATVPMLPQGPRATLQLTTDEDDPASALTAAKNANGAQLTAAWSATRGRFAAWIEREVAAQAAERADDLDAGLRDAEAPSTSPERLAELAHSEYVRVRVLVAAHRATPPATLELLARDADRAVRDALAKRP